MQKTLFIVVGVVAVILTAALFLVLRPQPAVAAAEAERNPRFVIGSADAPVTVVDFGNYLCGFCREHILEVFPLLQRYYIDTGKVRYIFRDFPFTGQENVIRAGEAAACAAEHNLFVEYHKVLFRGHRHWAGLTGASLDNQFTDLAGQIGIAPAAFRQCLEAGRKRAGVLADQRLALDLGLTSTPTFFVNGVKYTGKKDFQSWREILDRALAASDQYPGAGPARP
jgi:protein-disulfide isomerase